MSDQETTPWFDGNVKPVHIGVYQRQLVGIDGPNFAYWDGQRWSPFVGPSDTPDEAFRQRHSLSGYQCMPSSKCRGLMQKAGE